MGVFKRKWYCRFKKIYIFWYSFVWIFDFFTWLKNSDNFKFLATKQYKRLLLAYWWDRNQQRYCWNTVACENLHFCMQLTAHELFWHSLNDRCELALFGSRPITDKNAWNLARYRGRAVVFSDSNRLPQASNNQIKVGRHKPPLWKACHRPPQTKHSLSLIHHTDSKYPNINTTAKILTKFCTANKD